MATADLTTLTKVKTFGAITTTGDDTLLAEIITGVSVAMHREAGRRLVPLGDLTERHWVSTRTPHIVLHEWPVDASSITSVTEGSTALVAGTGYLLEHERILTRLEDSTTRGAWAKVLVVVVYDVKWTVNVPDPVVDLACQKQVIHEYHQAAPGGNRLGSSAKTSPTGDTIAYTPSGWLPDVLQVLRQQRRVV